MIPLYKTAAAVCLVALCGLQTEASTPTYKFKVEDVQPDAYLSANLARNGKLPIRISTVTKDDALVDSLNSSVQAATGENAGACEGLITSDLKKTFHHAFDYQVDAGTTPNYRQLLQEAVEEGLAAFDKNTYPQKETEWQTIWNKVEGANLAYLLGSESTRIGCVIGRCVAVTTGTDPQTDQTGRSDPQGPTETETNEAVLFCKLGPEMTKDTAPFSEEYFNGLTARTTALKDMTADDLQTPVGDGAEAAAIPTILIAGLVAMLTLVSA